MLLFGWALVIRVVMTLNALMGLTTRCGAANIVASTGCPLQSAAKMLQTARTSSGSLVITPYSRLAPHHPPPRPAVSKFEVVTYAVVASTTITFSWRYAYPGS